MSGCLGWTVPRACPHHRPEFNTLKNASNTRHKGGVHRTSAHITRTSRAPHAHIHPRPSQQH